MHASTREPAAAEPGRPTSEEAANQGGSPSARRVPRAAAGRLAAVGAALGLLLLPSPCAAQTLSGHPVVLDGTGKLLSWLPQQTAYSQIVQRVWNGFLNSIPVTQGLPAYYFYPYLQADLSFPNWPHSPGGTYAMFTDSAILSFPFTGNTAMMAAVKATLSYMLAHGMTASTDAWASVNYNESNPGATTYNGASGFGNGIGDGTGVLEPDKVAEFGLALLKFYEFDGTTAFRDQAIRNADVLAARRRTSTSATVSPWAFRVNASSGATVGGDDYCAHVIPAIKLWDELIRLGLGDTATYATARAAVWTWMMTYPMVNNLWAHYFEDMAYDPGNSNLNQYLPGNTARHLLEHPELDASWEAHARALIAWIESPSNFGKTQEYGATPIGEQTQYNNKMGSHTSRYGAVNALLYERTGDAAAKEKAYRALNWASYANRTDGLTLDWSPTPNQIWFTDGFGDYARHFMIAMAAVPEWAPPGETHLLRSTSVVRSVTYGANRVDYTTFDGAAQEVLRVAFTPTSVLGNGAALPQRTDLLQQGWTWDAASGVLRVRHDAATQVAVTGTAPTTLSISPTAASTPPRGSLTFTASGGSGTGFTWTLATNASGGSVGPASGVYTAGSLGSVTDVVQVSDSLANSATASVTVSAGVSISPATSSVPAGGSIAFTASGGSGGYAWTLPVNASGGSIDGATGRYQAGPTGGVSDVVQVADSLSNTATRTVAVTAAGSGLAIAPLEASTPPRGTVAFTASGGSGTGFTWTLATNASQGTIGPASGAYAAGRIGNVIDVVQVSDSVGNSATASVTVTAGVSISPATASVPPGGSVAFSASGGSESGFAWALSASASGGSIDDATGRYRAGSTGGVVDVVQVSDSLGNTATSSVTVTAAAMGNVKAGCGCSTSSVGLDAVAWLGLLAAVPRRRRR